MKKIKIALAAVVFLVATSVAVAGTFANFQGHTIYIAGGVNPADQPSFVPCKERKLCQDIATTTPCSIILPAAGTGIPTTFYLYKVVGTTCSQLLYEIPQ